MKRPTLYQESRPIIQRETSASFPFCKGILMPLLLRYYFPGTLQFSIRPQLFSSKIFAKKMNKRLLESSASGYPNAQNSYTGTTDAFLTSIEATRQRILRIQYRRLHTLAKIETKLIVITRQLSESFVQLYILIITLAAINRSFFHDAP